MLTVRTGSIEWAVLTYEPGGVMFGQSLGLQAHHHRPRIQEPVIVSVPVYDRVTKEPGWWMAKGDSHIETVGQSPTG